MTRTTAVSDEKFDTVSFLAISRSFFGLAVDAHARTTFITGADSVAGFDPDPVPRSAAASLLESSRRQIAAYRYRKVARSLLLATSLGAFIPGQAFASQEFWNMSDREISQERHAKLLVQHHQRLHEALRLTVEQESGWQKLLASEQPKQFVELGQTRDWAMLSVPERAEKVLELSRMQQAQLTEHVAALKSFYAMLSPGQKKTFEAFHAGSRG